MSRVIACVFFCAFAFPATCRADFVNLAATSAANATYMHSGTPIASVFVGQTTGDFNDFGDARLAMVDIPDRR